MEVPLLLGIYMKKTKTPMLTAALFTVAKIWKQPKCPSTVEWLLKMWYINNGMSFSYKK